MVSPGTARASTHCVGDSGAPRVASSTRTPSVPSARHSSSAYVHTPPTVSAVIKTRRTGGGVLTPGLAREGFKRPSCLRGLVRPLLGQLHQPRVQPGHALLDA